MKLVCAAAALLMSSQVASASERGAFLDRLSTMTTDQSRLAFEVMACSIEVAEAAARADQVTPAALMADAAAKDASTQCDGSALIAAVGKDEAATLAAMIHRVSVERALQVRRGEPTYLCADMRGADGRGCPVTK